MNCRFDNQPLKHVFLDLGHCPPSNSFLKEERLLEPEVTYPLKVFVSDRTFYVQVPEFKKASDIFNENYAYFSSFSTSWLKHCSEYVDQITKRLRLNNNSFVVEIASNDGYLLQYFKNKEIPCLGIEPSKSVADVAIKKGIDTLVDFFGEKSAKYVANEKRKADLIAGNNVFAHVPDVNDFASGLKTLLAPEGVVTLEFPHLLQLILENQFDTIYHEHYSYFSLFTVLQIVNVHGLEVFDVDEIPTHGGSLRVYLKHKESKRTVESRVRTLLEKEKSHGLLDMDTYKKFFKKAEELKLNFLSFLIEQKRLGKKVAAYGAAAKGNTLLNFCGVKSDLIDYVVDASPYKQGQFLPASHIPVVNENYLQKNKPDYVIIFPWNIKEEITQQLSYIRDWNAKFVVAVPKLKIF